ncbi:SDR family oxidoreductase [Acidovorax sp.]|uniref:SDR family oxidoreductase n=1 Tax=Acidovorax sp. TaxID=1872122 RepID=UPI00391D38B7
MLDPLRPQPSTAAHPAPAPSPASPQVVVITGASSGIGHATALAFARTGACLVLAARHAETLAPVAKACRAEGASAALAVPTDVTDADAVDRLARTALGHHGHIDVWVNGVGVGAVGGFEATPVAAHRRVVEANLLGHLYGAHAALRHFRERRRGRLINMISAGGWIPSPFAAAYTASKFGLRGLSAALRAEVSDLPDVHVCDVAPTFVDSPGLSHAANYTGRNIDPALPLLNPRRVADAVVALAQSPQPRAVTWLGAAAGPGRLAQTVAPDALGAFMRWATAKALGLARPAPSTDGNLFAPSRGTAVDGGRSKAANQALGRLAALGAVGLVLGVWAARQQQPAARPAPRQILGADAVP